MSLKSLIAAPALITLLTLPAKAQDPVYEFSSWMWATWRVQTDGSYDVKLDVWVKSDSAWATARVAVEYDANVFSFDRLAFPSADYAGGANPNVPFLPSCAGLGAGDTNVVLGIVGYMPLGGLDISTGRNVLTFWFDVPGGLDSLACRAEPFKFHCTPDYEGVYTTSFTVDPSGHEYYYGEPGAGLLALSNACLVGPYGAELGCYAPASCPVFEGWGYTPCPRCPPTLDPTKPMAVRAETWGTVKRLYQ